MRRSSEAVRPTKPERDVGPDLAAGSVADTLAALEVDPDTGLSSTEAVARLARYGSNEVAEQPEHQFRKFLAKFWGISAWMLELIMALSAFLRKYSDLTVVEGC